MLVFASILLASVVNDPGRFAGDAPFTLPRMEASGTWFRVLGDDSDRVSFAPSSTRFGIESRSKTDVVFRIRSGPGIPIRARYSLTADGIDFECVNGFTLRGGGSAPFITWKGGSVGPGVPAPPASWYLLSWPEARAPLLLVFLDQQAALIALESDGEYYISTEEGISGKVLLRLPVGTRRVSTRNAAELGSLLQECESAIGALQEPAPKVTAEIYREERDGVSVTWKFDRPGALVSPYVASGGNAAIRVTGQTTRMRDGSVVLHGTELSVSFRMNRLLPGAAVLQGGAEALQPPLSVNAERAETWGDAALAWLSGITHGAFMRAVERSLEASTSDPLKTRFFLVRALARIEEHETFGVDWLSWRVLGLGVQENAVLCCALALSDALEDRVAAAMIASSLFGVSAPLTELRREVFPPYGGSQASWFVSMTSPIRLMTGRGISAWGEGDDILIEGPVRSGGGISVQLYSNETLRVLSSANLRDVLMSNNGSIWTIVGNPMGSGIWRIRIGRPKGSKPLPRAVQGPSYSAVRR